MFETFPSETRTYRDRVSGVTVHQLTDYLAHSYHLYFTHPGWWDGGKRMLFVSERGNCSNLYSIELATGAITRITDNDPAHGRDIDFQTAGLSPVRDEVYVWYHDSLYAFDLRSGARRTLYVCEPGWKGSFSSTTADGRFIIASLGEKPGDRVAHLDLGAGYVGFRELYEAHLRYKLVRIPVDGGDAEVLHEENNWLGHVNPSPTRANLITYCHEGPWSLVGQRVWGLNLDTGERWKIRRQQPGEMIGHEYWMKDGVTVAYHGARDGQGLYGFCKYDNSDAVEAPFPFDSNHFHSNMPDLIVADGPAKGLTPYVLLFRFDGERFHGPRVLCIHRGSRHIQHLHIHPTFTPDGKQVLFTADPRGYGQVFLADVPPFEELPTLDEVEAKRRR